MSIEMTPPRGQAVAEEKNAAQLEPLLVFPPCLHLLVVLAARRREVEGDNVVRSVPATRLLVLIFEWFPRGLFGSQWLGRQANESYFGCPTPSRSRPER
ncbi:MAG: hypothetical protein JWN95_1729 [Frankiales bacterium]|nr:hypothetical protein [Frankiales bacterium]